MGLQKHKKKYLFIADAKPGFWDITSMDKEPTFLTVKYLSVGRHRQALAQSRQIFHVAPWVPLRQNMLVARSD